MSTPRIPRFFEFFATVAISVDIAFPLTSKYTTDEP